jgi:hypothetical protein
VGSTTHSRNHIEGKNDLIVVIKLDPKDTKEAQELASHQASICSTLLHEMIHAYLFDYSCDRYHDLSGKCTRKGKVLWPKGRFHDLAWFHLACAIEVYMQRFTGLEVNLGCLRGYVADCRNGGTLFFAPEWRRFFKMDWGDCCKLFDGLDIEEQNELSTILEKDPMVMALWAEMGDQSSGSESSGSDGGGGSGGSGGDSESRESGPVEQIGAGDESQGGGDEGAPYQCASWSAVFQQW